MKKFSLPITLSLALVFGITVVLAAGLLNLPATPVTISHGAWNAGSLGSTIDITLSNVPAGYDVTNGVYAGWCLEDNHMPNAPQVTGTLIEPTGPPWDKINYVLNHKQGTAQDVQVAIWLLNGTYDGTFPVTASALAMVNDANTNGGGFVPGPGQVVAVIAYADGFGAGGYQDTIIEVPLPPTPPPPPPPPGGEGCTPGYWRNHFEDWPPTGYAPSDDFDATFGVNYFTTNITLGQAVKLGGGDLNKLARHGTAALLSAAHPDVDYPYTVAQVIAFVQAGNVDPLTAANELGCSIP